MSRRIALLIGNTDYDDRGLAKLNSPEMDIRALADLLQDPQIGAFDEVTPLFNHPFADVYPAIAEFFADKGREDTLLLYFSGHGVLDDQGRLYLALKNTRLNRLSGSALPANFLKDEMDRSRSKRQILLLDCCHSGAFGRGAKAAVGEQAITEGTFAGQGHERVVLTATDKTEMAWEGDQIIDKEMEMSLFTHFVVEGLRTGAADGDGDGAITPNELYNYVFERVVEATHRQKPHCFVYDRGGELHLAHNPRPRPAQLSPELQEALSSPYVGTRDEALRELMRLLNGHDRGRSAAAQIALQQLAEHDDSRRIAGAAAQAMAAYISRQQEVERERQQEAERLERERLAAQKVDEERQARAQGEVERQAKEQAELEHQQEAERLERERLAAQKADEERQARAIAEAERQAKEQAELERQQEAERLERERLAAQKADEERQARAIAEAERQAKEQAELEHQQEAERLERERIAAQKADEERQAKERAELERQQEAERLERQRQQEAERLVRERLAALKADEERQVRAKAEAERQANERAVRLRQQEAERLERERLAALKADEERHAQERAEAERAAKEQAERLRLQEAERLERERFAAQKEDDEERQAQERAEAERLAMRQAELERQQEAERLERVRLGALKADEKRHAQERAEAERAAKEQAERLRQQEADRLERQRQAAALPMRPAPVVAPTPAAPTPARRVAGIFGRILLTAVGWAIALAVAAVLLLFTAIISLFTLPAVAIAGGIGGLFTGLALRDGGKFIRARQVGLVALTWAICASLLQVAYTVTGQASVTAVLIMTALWLACWGVAGAVTAHIGLRRLGPDQPPRAQRFFIVAVSGIAWSVGLLIAVVGAAIGAILAGTLMVATTSGSSGSVALIVGSIVVLAAAAIAGAIGSGVMLLLLGSAAKKIA